MKKIVLALSVPAWIYAHSLSALIESALETNQMIKASEYTQQARAQELDSQKSSYYPTLDVGAAYISLDKHISFQAGNTLNIYAKAGVDLFDGFRKSAQVDQKKNVYNASKYDLHYAQKTLTLDIVKDFFNIKSMEASSEALMEKSKQLQADIKKIKKFREAGLAPQDYVDKLRSAYDANNYALESLKLTIKTVQNYLSLKSGMDINSLEEATLENPQNLAYKPSEAIKSMQEKASSIEAAAKATDATYYPNVRLEDTYGYYDYSRNDGLKKLGIDEIDKQNKIALMANMRLFDNGTIKKQKQALKLQKKALQEQIHFQIKQEKIRYNLARQALKTAKLNIKSAMSAKKAALSVYKSIKAKFDAGIVDQVTYLDALSQKTASQARVQKAKNDFEIAKANYYFSSNKNIKDYIK